ncbi:MAG: L,D-transpeptidase family protein [Clostridia bacterium]|nr:L,D-transpeptidase family protein [Clostridia bacterium]
MIKVYKLKLILKILVLVIIILITTLILQNKFNIHKTITVFSKSKTEYKILVDVEDSKLYLFENNELVKTYKCSGGKWSTPSPIGTWTIISKAKWGEGFRTEVGYGLNVPWGQFGIHGTLDKYSVGWSSSHGCIRMNNNEVAELYKIVPIGTKVTIIDGVYGEFGKGLRTLKSGMYGSDVMQIQKKLKKLGHFTGEPNGKFGSETEKAVQKYCKENALYVRKIIDIELQKHMGFELID